MLFRSGTQAHGQPRQSLVSRSVPRTTKARRETGGPFFLSACCRPCREALVRAARSRCRRPAAKAESPEAEPSHGNDRFPRTQGSYIPQSALGSFWPTAHQSPRLRRRRRKVRRFPCTGPFRKRSWKSAILASLSPPAKAPPGAVGAMLVRPSLAVLLPSQSSAEAPNLGRRSCPMALSIAYCLRKDIFIFQ